MHANDDTPRNGENVSEESFSEGDARTRFLQLNLQLIRDRVDQARAQLGERSEQAAYEELERAKTEIVAVEEMLEAREAETDGGHRGRGVSGVEWRCRECGNVMMREQRPTRCLQCRQGEHEYGEKRLTERVER